MGLYEHHGVSNDNGNLSHISSTANEGTKPYLVAISHFSTPLIYKKDRTPIDCINLKLLFSDPQ